MRVECVGITISHTAVNASPQPIDSSRCRLPNTHFGHKAIQRFISPANSYGTGLCADLSRVAKPLTRRTRNWLPCSTASGRSITIAPNTPETYGDWSLISAVESLKRTRSNSWSDLADNEALITGLVNSANNNHNHYFTQQLELKTHQNNFK
ncbi:unnamed protein product [Medioppia subpectinata]|uniref:Uncharacterized protein n=1 Tax=Medioppia subpectinata TaxID=1979941 RepID=A0A7R9Q0K1_9ACAR|nr:unnamed protein product [Medioppia subpectinata]CAG2107406.1 unnamed protein product [Medioppia subpectinata]